MTYCKAPESVSSGTKGREVRAPDRQRENWLRPPVAGLQNRAKHSPGREERGAHHPISVSGKGSGAPVFRKGGVEAKRRDSSWKAVGKAELPEQDEFRDNGAQALKARCLEGSRGGEGKRDSGTLGPSAEQGRSMEEEDS